MESNNYMEYVDKESISAALKCKICENPFSDPTITNCNHVFCYQCIHDYLKTHSTCPSQLCNQLLQTDNLKPHPSGLTIDILDQLPVKCTLCNETDICRRDFDKHINKDCPKIQMSCSMRSFGCPWTGANDQLSQHTKICVFQMLQPMFQIFCERFRSINGNMENLQNQIQERIEELKTILTERIEKQMTDLENAIENQKMVLGKQARQENSRMKNDLETFKNQIEDQMNQQTVHFQNQRETENAIIESIAQEVKQQDVKIKCVVTETEKQMGVLKSQLHYQIKQRLAEVEGKIENQKMELEQLVRHELETFKTQVQDQIDQQIVDCKKERGIENAALLERMAHEMNQRDAHIKYAVTETEKQMNVLKSQLHDQIKQRLFEIENKIENQKMASEQQETQENTRIRNELEILKPQIQEKMSQQLNELEKSIQERKQKKISIREEIAASEENTNHTLWRIRHLLMPHIPANATWIQRGVTVAGGEYGRANNQLRYPKGLYVDDDQTVFIADLENHRIMQWKKDDTNGQIVAGGNGQGNGLDQLNEPTNVLIDKETDNLIIADQGNKRVVRWSRRDGTTQGEILIGNIECWELALDYQRYLYVADTDKHEVRRYKLGDENGTVVAGRNRKGDGLNQLNSPTYLFVDQQQNVYVSDSNNHRIMKWNKGAKEGIVVLGGNGYGSALTKLHWPNGLFVDTLYTLYTADSHNNRVLRSPQGTVQSSLIIGELDFEAEINQFQGPIGLSFDRHGNLYVVDWSNHRVQRFSIQCTT